MKRTDMFWAGFVMYPCLSSLHQDALGKDAYVRLVSDAWISGWWTVPISSAADADTVLRNVQSRFAVNGLLESFP